MNRNYLSKRRPHYDRAVRMIRHSDNLKDIAIKIKQKAVDLANQFKQMKTGQKIAIVLLKISQAVSAVYAAKTANEVRKQIQTINVLKKHAITMSDRIEAYKSTGNANVPFGISEGHIRDLKVKALKQGLKALLGLLVAFVAYSKEKIVKAGLPSDYSAENHPEG
jgi:hypothetical protein